MRALTRWTVAVAGSLAVFVGSWAICRYLAGLDNGTSLAIAGAPLAAALSVLAWWAARELTVVSEQSLNPISRALAASVAGGRNQAVAGNTGIIIGGDVRGATIRINSGPEDGKPLPASTDDLVLVGDIPQRPLAFQPRDTLLATLREHVDSRGIGVIHAVTGMRGTGKTQAVAAYARERIADRWRLVAWVNAHSTAAAVDRLAQTATAMKILSGEDQPSTARALRHWLETDGHRCLVVFDNAPDPDTLRPYLPAAGLAHIIITSTRQSITSLGTSIPVDVFTQPEALAYLAQRGGMTDTDGARAVATELGYLPLALTQAAAVIAAQHLTYHTYLVRLRAFPLAKYLTRTKHDPYPHAVAAAILLALRNACDSDSTGLAASLMWELSALWPALSRPELDLIYERLLTAATAAQEAAAMPATLQVHLAAAHSYIGLHLPGPDEPGGAEIDAIRKQVLSHAMLLAITPPLPGESAEQLLARISSGSAASLLELKMRAVGAQPETIRRAQELRAGMEVERQLLLGRQADVDMTVTDAHLHLFPTAPASW